jgi:hypothetical protein
MMRTTITFLLLFSIQLCAGIGIGESTPGPLPVELTSFSATISGNTVCLSWTTATETKNYGFEIERTPLTQEGWETIGFIKGSGNSNSPKEYSFTDISNHSFRYRLKQIDTDGKFTYSKEIEVNNLLPLIFNLAQNYPNPFNPSTVISYSIPEASNVKLEVYNVLGKVITTLVNKIQEAGVYNISFNAAELSSGVYYYTIQAGTYFATKKMLYLR